jgi:type III secretory pathway lipoprotein EscJ
VSADVTVAVAGDPVEADQIRAVLRQGGIESRLEAAELDGAAPLLDGPCRVLVEGSQLERAMELLEADDDEDEDGDDE